MKIKPTDNLNKIDKIRNTSKVNQAKPVSKTIKDEVVISKSAKIMERAIEKAKMSDAEKTQKVSELKKAVKNNTYKVDADKLAEKILQSSVGFDKKG